MPWDVVTAAAPRRLVRLADPRSESALETELRILLARAELPPTHVQLAVAHYRLDLAYLPARVAIEVDGRAHHSDRADFQRDRTRQNELVLAGWTVLRFTAADIRRRPHAVVAAVRAALEVSGAVRAG